DRPTARPPAGGLSPAPRERARPVAAHDQGVPARPRAVLRVLRPVLRRRLALGPDRPARRARLPRRAGSPGPLEALRRAVALGAALLLSLSADPSWHRQRGGARGTDAEAG